MILALDTTGEFGSIALWSAAGLVKEVPIHAKEGFGHVIFGHLQELGVEMGSIECFAAASGPGSFTGVRVGLSCIKGLAEATGRPAVAVSTLAALSTFGSGPVRAVMMDARRGEVYGGLYDDRRRPLMPEMVAERSVWLATLPEGVELISMDGAPRALAGAVAGIAYARFQAGLAVDPALIEANYVRRPDAELLWKGFS